MIPWLRASRRAVSVTYAFNDMYSSTNSVSPDTFFLYSGGYLPKVRPIILLHELGEVIVSRRETIGHMGME